MFNFRPESQSAAPERGVADLYRGAGAADPPAAAGPRHITAYPIHISPDQILLFDPGIVQINCGNGMNGGLVAVILLLVALFVFPTTPQSW